jgi:hypothetical protein
MSRAGPGRRISCDHCDGRLSHRALRCQSGGPSFIGAVRAVATKLPSPTLYYFVSAPVPAPVRFTISADRQVTPVLEVDIPSPKAAGVYGLPLADFGVKLEPGVGYVWSVSATLSAEEPSDDIVASAALLRTVPDPAIERALRDASTSQ